MFKPRYKTIVVRSGGDIATGVIQKLWRSGFAVVALDIAAPSCIRRGVSLSECVYTKEFQVEDIKAVLIDQPSDIHEAHKSNCVPVLVDPRGDTLHEISPVAVIDAIIAKKNLGTNRDMAPVTIGLGPGFEANIDVDIVIETKRGHQLGRLIFEGSAHPNTGTPGDIGGETTRRVIHSPYDGKITLIKNIGDSVTTDSPIACVGRNEIYPHINGILRGMIKNGFSVEKGLKIADVDPRPIPASDCFMISDKARNIGGAALEAVLLLCRQKNISIV